jgi:hypothetical protein
MKIFKVEFGPMAQAMTAHRGVQIIKAAFIAQLKVASAQFEIVFKGRRSLTGKFALGLYAPEPALPGKHSITHQEIESPQSGADGLSSSLETERLRHFDPDHETGINVPRPPIFDGVDRPFDPFVIAKGGIFAWADD